MNDEPIYKRRRRRDFTPKATITIRLPLDVMNHFRAQSLALPPSKRPSVPNLIQECVVAYVASGRVPEC
jgi:hypothetical protein